MEKNRIAIITARGGSKRIPKKNIRDFCGKPIIAYSIEAAIESDLFDEIMVSTDSEEIADIARKYGASVPFMRNEFTSGDFATTDDVLKEVLLEYQKRGIIFSQMACIYPTAPFVTAQKIKDSLKIMDEMKADAVYFVVKFSFPPQRAFVINNGILEYKYPEYEFTRSQDLEAIYHDCGQFYWMKPEHYLDGIPEKVRIPYIVSEMEVQDIDNETDWELAELKYINMM